MNILDIIIIITLSAGFFLGWKLRAIHLIGMILALCAGIWIANHYHEQLIGLFHGMPATIDRSLAWLTTFLASAISISILVSFISKAFEFIKLKWLDHLLGAALAVAVAFCLLLISLLVINSMATTYKWKIVKHSAFAQPLLNVSRPLLKRTLKEYPSLKRIFLIN